MQLSADTSFLRVDIAYMVDRRVVLFADPVFTCLELS